MDLKLQLRPGYESISTAKYPSPVTQGAFPALLSMTRKQRTLLMGATLVPISPPAWGWGEVGHRVVGRVAAALLTPAARKKVAGILEVDNTKTAVADALADAAEWPDAVARVEYQRSNPWHFIDLGVKSNPAKDN